MGEDTACDCSDWSNNAWRFTAHTFDLKHTLNVPMRYCPWCRNKLKNAEFVKLCYPASPENIYFRVTPGTLDPFFQKPHIQEWP